ncbi:dTDP-4-dehydrorhamnose 3,5-epimerase [Vibrio aestuarianus]|uniref:dTDP-4-dehydrorhamnose 3,5-epimerase n=1 Tax=Vibrio aestuarianus TaxID=28171 RepID=UPI00237CBD6C|nr:dTDP-4-dehydrorhamnose 3,5-epimerase [Vibrio aestuarianus]MDE1326596.1 dTDP-4-dehydrorhamnose 3,5-epimerase [Vibrio aestuarianus]
MKVINTRISDVKIIEPTVFGDDRGFFMETWRQNEFEEKVTKGPCCFLQDNHSKSKKGILRGLHYQSKNSQGKLVRVILGEVFDVAVDIRKTSPTYGEWVGEVLSAENKKQLWVPEGFAHGFYVMSDEAEFVYKCTDYYTPEFEHIIQWNDKTLDITWPILEGDVPSLSEKDMLGKSFKSLSDDNNL